MLSSVSLLIVASTRYSCLSHSHDVRSRATDWSSIHFAPGRGATVGERRQRFEQPGRGYSGKSQAAAPPEGTCWHGDLWGRLECNFFLDP